ncbi:hypothetical protein [Nostoc sp. NMS8]|uniref:hypothetical protein n=1 Tax=Nostoc sp. NMS8 TaxID=2815392 RepID=UPI0025FDCAC4|nr:hypothetical protein [Nostoc sp. NMS8]MBN3960209.1 hypothetical protein [Nostoc sp. NMS8]
MVWVIVVRSGCLRYAIALDQLAAATADMRTIILVGSTTKNRTIKHLMVRMYRLHRFIIHTKAE